MLNKTQLYFLASNLPQPCKIRGRKSYSNIELLAGILQVLRSGCRWRDLDTKRKKGEASSITHWRRLQFWKNSEYFPLLWNLILTQLKNNRKLNIHIISIDGTFIPSFSFKQCSAYSGKEKKVGVKVSQVVDALGIPLTFKLDKGNLSDFTMAEPTINQLPESIFAGKCILLADKGYDSRSFRSYLLGKRIRENIKRKQYSKNRLDYDNIDGFYDKTLGKLRFVVERTNAWMKSFRRLKFRFDRTKKSFEAFLYLAVLVICVRNLLN